MSLTGSGLYTAIKPILDEGCSDLFEFRTKMGAKISEYVASNAALVGLYTGTTPLGAPVISPAAAVLIPTAPLPPLLANPMPFTDFRKWIEKTIENDELDPEKGTVLWNITAVEPFVNTPEILDPTVTFLDLYEDFSDIRTSYGFWALICDAIICCINGYIPTTTPATTTGSAGSITWTPIEVPELKHNFVFRTTYDLSETALVNWINEHVTETNVLSGTIDVPIDDNFYKEALILWKSLTLLTDKCEFYKKQDDGELILLTTGAQF